MKTVAQKNARLFLILFAGIICYSFVQPLAHPKETHAPAQEVTLNDGDQIDHLLLFRSEETDRTSAREGEGEAHMPARMVPSFHLATEWHALKRNQPYFGVRAQAPLFLAYRQLLI